MTEKISLSNVVSPNKAKKGIRKCIKIQRPIFIWGPPGIGKSDIIKQIGNEQGREVIDVRLSLWEPTDIKGIPYYSSLENTMKWATPSELPSLISSTAILFLDEFNSAAPATQAAAYQLILNRRVGTYELPKGVAIVAAGNRESDKGITYRMPSPLANRFIHLELTHDFADWNKWALQNKVHEQIVGYLEYAKGDLYSFDPKSPSRAFATPRSWSFVSELLTDDDLDDDILFDLVSGSVGEGIAIKFMAHRKVAKQLPKSLDILNGTVTKITITEMSAIYTLVLGMCYDLEVFTKENNEDLDVMIDRFIKFMLDNIQPELTVMGIRAAMREYNIPIDPTRSTVFDEFHDKYGSFIMDAMEKN